MRRRHRTSALDELRKRFSLRRPFICTRCGWSGWIDEAFLRYEARAPQTLQLTDEESASDRLPELDLDATQADARASDGSPREGASAATAATDAASIASDILAHASLGPRQARGGGALEADDDVPDLSLDRECEVTPGAHAQAQPGPVAEDGAMAGLQSAETAPYSVKVGQTFHHQGRHTGRSCPSCHAWALYRSRTRTLAEGLRRSFTTALLYRCHTCGWRGWVRDGWS